jgi:hypothetical protein
MYDANVSDAFVVAEMPSDTPPHNDDAPGQLRERASSCRHNISCDVMVSRTGSRPTTTALAPAASTRVIRSTRCHHLAGRGQTTPEFSERNERSIWRPPCSGGWGTDSRIDEGDGGFPRMSIPISIRRLQSSGPTEPFPQGWSRMCGCHIAAPSSCAIRGGR